MPRAVTRRRNRRTRLPRGAVAAPVIDAGVGLPLYEREGIFREAWKEFRELRRYRELVRYLVSSSLKLDTAGTVLGGIWWLLDPLLLMAVYVTLVDVILQRGGQDYALFVLVAVIAWKHFSSGCGRAMGNTIRREDLMRQVRFPRSVLPLSAVLAVTVHFGFGILLLVAVAVAFGIYPTVVFPLILLVAAIQFAFTLGFAFLFSGLNFFFRDVQAVVAYSFSLWFFLSPGLYAISDVPERVRPLFEVNPFTPILESYRDVLMYGELPAFRGLLVVGGISLLVLGLGYVAFVRLAQSFTKLS